MLPLLLAGLACASQPALPGPPPPQHEEEAHQPSPRHHGFHTIVAVKALGGWVNHDHHGEASIGASVFLEHVLITHVLELELAGGWVRHGGEDAVPLEALLKAPLLHFGINELHAGAGVVVAVPSKHPDQAQAGIIATADVFSWFHPRVGLLVEVNVQEFPAVKGNLFEAELGVGIAARF